MNRIKCATFDKEMQDSIPAEIREKMKADRAKVEKEQETKAKTLPIQNVVGSASDIQYCFDCVNYPPDTHIKSAKCRLCSWDGRKQTKFERRAY